MKIFLHAYRSRRENKYDAVMILKIGFSGAILERK